MASAAIKIQDLRKLDRAFSRADSPNLDLTKTTRQLRAALAVWQSRTYIECDHKETNEKKRERAINRIVSLIAQIADRGFLTPKQADLVQRTIKNARKQDGYLFYQYISNSNPSSSKSISISSESTATNNQSTETIERKSAEMSTDIKQAQQPTTAQQPPLAAAQQPAGTQAASATPQPAKTNGVSPSLLPTAKTPQKKSIADLTILTHGQPKIGKTTFWSFADSAIFLATEAGHNHLEVFQVSIPTWEKFVEVGREIARGNHQFRTLVIDTIDNLYEFCRDYVCRQHNIKHESDLPFGKGYGLVNSEFKRVINGLSHLPYGLVMISHSKIEEQDTRLGKIKKTVPTLSSQGRSVVLGMADMILFFDMDVQGKEQKRVIRTKPAANYEAGDRTGCLPETIEMEQGPERAFDLFRAAYEKSKGEVK